VEAEEIAGKKFEKIPLRGFFHFYLNIVQPSRLSQKAYRQAIFISIVPHNSGLVKPSPVFLKNFDLKKVKFYFKII
jgi:hypothetical protein